MIWSLYLAGTYTSVCQSTRKVGTFNNNGMVSPPDIGYTGYSGVAIYTRNSVCAPIRAEEGITGILYPPNSSTSFYDLPQDQQIGGYPTVAQLANSPLDAATLDSEGRCVILEFPVFVLIGVYSPANRDETRDDFRLGFLNALDARVRNLVAAGKRVFLTGDLNIIRSELDTANAEEQLRKHGMTSEEYISTPARRFLNQLLVGGKVIGERDEGREEPILWDICRGFHPGRKGMFTCWETKINARPGNFGSRIDYVLCSLDWKDWFSDSNIQEGLIGSDHCPVYAIIKDIVDIDGVAVHIKDVVNPPGMFKDGNRIREWNSKDLLPTSAKLIPEFDRRRNIRDMFAKKPSLPTAESSMGVTKEEDVEKPLEFPQPSISTPPAVEEAYTSSRKFSTSTNRTLIETALPDFPTTNSASMAGGQISPKANGKRSADSPTSRALKRTKSGGSNATSVTNNKSQLAKGQSSLKGFFKPKNVPCESATPSASYDCDSQESSSAPILSTSSAFTTSISSPADSQTADLTVALGTDENFKLQSPNKTFNLDEQQDVIDPIVAKESWSKLLSKRVVPRCEHNEPCISYLTKKPGINCGRSFYMCPRPLGPSGQREKGTQWRCGTFVWSSDWTGDGT
jgi:AP endonuclease-2